MKDLNVEKVLEIMKEEKSIFDELLIISQKKTDALVKREIEELDKINKIEIELSEKIRMLEDLRCGAVYIIAQSKGLKEENPDVSTLAKVLEPENSKSIILLRDEINNSIKELKNMNEINGKLLKNSLDYVDFLMNLVTNAGESSDNNYSSQGKHSDGNAPRRMFDLKL